jgi:hypothetical protein
VLDGRVGAQRIHGQVHENTHQHIGTVGTMSRSCDRTLCTARKPTASTSDEFPGRGAPKVTRSQVRAGHGGRDGGAAPTGIITKGARGACPALQIRRGARAKKLVQESRVRA